MGAIDQSLACIFGLLDRSLQVFLGELICARGQLTDLGLNITGHSLVPRSFGSPVLRLREQVLACHQEAPLQVNTVDYQGAEAQTYRCQPLLSVLSRLKKISSGETRSLFITWLLYSDTYCMSRLASEEAAFS